MSWVPNWRQQPCWSPQPQALARQQTNALAFPFDVVMKLAYFGNVFDALP
jgi:hypothetical protein